MSNPIDRFKGCAKAEAGGGRVPNPELGKAAYKIDQVRMKDGRTSGFRVEISMTSLWGIEPGVDAKGVERGPDRAGTKVSQCIFSGDYFLKNFKEFCLKALGMEPHQELDIANMICPSSDHPGKDDLARIEIMWETVLPGLVCAFDPKDGSATDAGIFDGQVVVEIGTTEKEIEVKVNDQPTFDANGNAITKTYRNSYFNRAIGKAEIKENLDEAGINRFFGSAKKLEELED